MNRPAWMGKEEPKAPKWYSATEIKDAIKSGRFREPKETVAEAIARHLQLALEKGWSMGWRKRDGETP